MKPFLRRRPAISRLRHRNNKVRNKNHMSTTAINPRTSKYFEALQVAMQKNADFTRAVNDYVKCKSGHPNIVLFMKNGSPDNEKEQLCLECLRAWKIAGQDAKAFPLIACTTNEIEPENVDDENDNELEQEAEQQEEEASAPAPRSGSRIVSEVIEEVENDQDQAIQKALKLLGKAIAQPKKVEINEERVLEILKEQAPGLLKADILNWLKVPIAEIDAKATEAMGKFNRSILEQAVIAALQSAVGQKIAAGVQSGELEVLPTLQPVDPTYVRNRVSTRIERAIAKGHHIIVSGPSGSGKTYPIENEHRIAGKRYIGPISCGSGITNKHIVAREWLKPTAEKGVAMQWIYGFLIRAMQMGVTLILDEISQLEKEVISHIYYAMEYGVFHIAETGETITAKPGFAIMGTDNALTDTSGLYSGYGLSIALTNRFKFIYADYMDSVSEIAIFELHGVNGANAQKIRTFLEKARELYTKGIITFAPSTRTGKEIAKELADGQSWDDAVNYCIAHGLPAEDAAKILKVAA